MCLLAVGPRETSQGHHPEMLKAVALRQTVKGHLAVQALSKKYSENTWRLPRPPRVSKSVGGDVAEHNWHPGTLWRDTREHDTP